MDKSKLIVGCFFLLLLAVGIYFGLNQGYGEMGARGYSYSKAMYMACNQKDKEKLAEISAMIDKDLEQGVLSSQESVWLYDIIALGMEENWKQASSEVRQLMDEQIQYVD